MVRTIVCSSPWCWLPDGGRAFWAWLVRPADSRLDIRLIFRRRI